LAVAKALASLNHPNIAQLFGLEEGPGGAFLVMELVEGPTLADVHRCMLGVVGQSGTESARDGLARARS